MQYCSCNRFPGIKTINTLVQALYSHKHSKRTPQIFNIIKLTTSLDNI